MTPDDDQTRRYRDSAGGYREEAGARTRGGIGRLEGRSGEFADEYGSRMADTIDYGGDKSGGRGEDDPGDPFGWGEDELIAAIKLAQAEVPWTPSVLGSEPRPTWPIFAWSIFGRPKYSLGVVAVAVLIAAFGTMSMCATWSRSARTGDGYADLHIREAGAGSQQYVVGLRARLDALQADLDESRQANFDLVEILLHDKINEEVSLVHSPSYSPGHTLAYEEQDDRRRMRELILARPRLFLPLLKRVISQRQDPGVREAAVATLGELGSARGEAVPILVEALHETDAAVRARAAIALGNCGPAARNAIPILRALAAQKDETERVKQACSTTLSKLASVP